MFFGTAKEIITFYSDNVDQQKLEYALLKSMIDFDINVEYQQLSTGQKQRVKIAWCFYYDKNIIIFDEALSNLDSKTSIAIENNVLALQNIMFIHISHYLNKINKEKYRWIKM